MRVSLRAGGGGPAVPSHHRAGQGPRLRRGIADRGAAPVRPAAPRSASCLGHYSVFHCRPVSTCSVGAQRSPPLSVLPRSLLSSILSRPLLRAFCRRPVLTRSAVGWGVQGRAGAGGREGHRTRHRLRTDQDVSNHTTSRCHACRHLETDEGHDSSTCRCVSGAM